MTKNIPRLVLFALFIWLLTINAMGQTHEPRQLPTPESPAAQPTQSIDLGQLDGTAYANSSFGLSLSIPKDWVVLEAQRLAAFTQQTKKMVHTPDQKKIAKIEGSIDRSSTLLRLTKLPDGQPKNAQFMLIAERLASPEIKTGLDVIAVMRETMKGTNFTLELLGEAHTETVSGVEFGVADIKVTSSYGSYRQKIYIAVRGDYALEFFYTYLDDADLPAFAQMMKSVRLK